MTETFSPDAIGGETVTERRACTGCGHVRPIKVSRGTSLCGKSCIYYNEWCAACDDEWKAVRHERAAKKFRARSAALRLKRGDTGGRNAQLTR